MGCTALELDSTLREAAYAVALRRIEPAVIAASPLCPDEASVAAQPKALRRR